MNLPQTSFGEGLPPRSLENKFPTLGDKWINTNNSINYLFQNNWKSIPSFNLNQISTLYEENIDAVVRLLSTTVINQIPLISTGFFISADGFIITDAHNIYDESKNIFYENMYVGIYPENILLKAQIIGISIQVDTALLKIDLDDSSLPANLKPLPPRKFLKIANSRTQKKGTPVIVLGHPGISSVHIQTVSFGIISDNKYFDRIDDKECIVDDTDIGQGNSGGPIINFKGEVIATVNFGVISRITNQIDISNLNRSTNLLLPIINYFKDNFINEGKTGQNFPQGFFGINYRYLDPISYLSIRGPLLTLTGPDKIEGIIINSGNLVSEVSIPGATAGTPNATASFSTILPGSPAAGITGFGLTGEDIILEASAFNDSLKPIGRNPTGESFDTIVNLARNTGTINIKYLRKLDNPPYSIEYTVTGIGLTGLPNIFKFVNDNFFT